MTVVDKEHSKWRLVMENVVHLNRAELEAGFDEIRQSPKDNGELMMIVRRPGTDRREVLVEGELNLEQGLAGDDWRVRGSSSTEDGSAHPDMQITIMNARVIALLAQEAERWQLAGDQLYLDLDLSEDNLPPGTQLAIGTAIIEVTEIPHTGCRKFAARFGLEGMKFVNSAEGKRLHLRGINARVVKSGRIQVGDKAEKL
jgi:MOSC domain-containing protein YiiM